MQKLREYRVTQHGYHQDPDPDSEYARVVFSDLEEGPAMAYYYRHVPVRPGVVLAVWGPDGSLIASTSRSHD